MRTSGERAAVTRLTSSFSRKTSYAPRFSRCSSSFADIGATTAESPALVPVVGAPPKITAVSDVAPSPAAAPAAEAAAAAAAMLVLSADRIC